MKIAITGASGFLGRHLVAEFAGHGHSCRGLIRPESRRFATKPAIDWAVGGLDDPAAVAALVDGMEALVHAAHDRPGDGFQDPGGDVATLVERNVLGTIRLIEAARRAGVGRVVLITSGAVHDVVLGDRPLDEAHPLWPKTHYGATKAAIEAFVHSYGKGDGYPIAALRPTAIYGMAEPVERSRWYDLVAAVARGEAVDCRKGAKVVHAADVARAALLLLTTAEPIAGEVYHCVDRFTTEREVAEVAQSIAGTSGPIAGDTPSNRHPITSAKLLACGMNFGGESLLRTTVAALVASCQAPGSAAS